MSTALLDSSFAESSDSLFETVNGQRVEKTPRGAYAVAIAFELGRVLANYLAGKRLGLVNTEALYVIST